MAFAATLQARILPSILEYGRITDALADSRIRITTGQRIVRNGDDASALSAATQLQTQTSTLRSALVSGARATSFLQVASDGLSQIRTILAQLSDLTANANLPGQSSLSYATLDAQFQTSLTTIDSIVAATRFNGASILDGSADGSGAPVLYLGANSSDTVTLAIPDVSSASLLGTGLSLSNAVNAAAATITVGNAGNSVADAIARIDAYQQRLDVADATVRQTLYGINTAIEDLLGTDTDAEERRSSHDRLQQQTSAVILAQASRVSSTLLGLLSPDR